MSSQRLNRVQCNVAGCSRLSYRRQICRRHYNASKAEIADAINAPWPTGETSDGSGRRWLDVVGFEGAYRVSDDGRIFSRPRTGTRGGELRQKLAAPGWYPAIQMGWPQRVHRVHVLVATAFHGPRPSADMEVRHLNGNVLDNRADNLTWGTKSQNMHDVIRHGTHPKASRTECSFGHPFAGRNVIYRPDKRRCRTCTAARAELCNDPTLDPAAVMARFAALYCSPSHEVGDAA